MPFLQFGFACDCQDLLEDLSVIASSERPSDQGFTALNATEYQSPIVLIAISEGGAIMIS
jgi:hypothetical protein